MGTTIRAEVSKSNEYWIERHRYYELKHFCLQHPIWKKIYYGTDGYAKQSQGEKVDSFDISDPVTNAAIRREQYLNNINLIEKVAKETDEEMQDYIVMAVTKGMSYTILQTKYNIPCGKDYWYKLYRRFFWLLDIARK